MSISAWPGGGFRLTVEWPAAQGDNAPQFAVDAAEDSSVFVQAAPVESGITAIVVEPELDPTAHALIIEAATALVTALPEQERIGIWVAGQSIRLTSDVTRDRAHLLARLADVPPQQSAQQSEASHRLLRDSIATLEGPWGTRSRFLVWLDAAEGTRLLSGSHPVTSLRLSAQHNLAADAGVSGWQDAAPAIAGAQLADHIAARRTRLFDVAMCSKSAAGDTLRISLHDTTCRVTAPAAIEHERQRECTGPEILQDAYPFEPVVELLLTERQRAEYDRLDSEGSEEPFSASFQLGSGAPIEMEAHFRGFSSLACERKSLSVDLKGGSLRRIAQNASSDEFYLISLCVDDRYFRQLLGNRIMADLGLFPMASRLVELRINGESRGAYLLLEKPTHFVRKNHSDVRGIVRRRHDTRGQAPSLKFPDPGAAGDAALERYSALAELAMNGDPATLYEQLAARMDLDGYLTWLAANTALGNGDYVDEIFFYAAPELGEEGPWYFRVHAWDLDDIGQPCHHEGRYALDRGNGLLFCVEAELDQALLRSDAVYARYVAILESLLRGRLSEQNLAEDLNTTREVLFSVLNHGEACAAMQELVTDNPDAADCSIAQADIASHMDAYAKSFAARRAQLLSAIATYRSDE